jgi:hypothetical protein
VNTAICHDCQTAKPLDQFYLKANGRPRSYCRACENLRSRRWAIDHPERIRLAMRRADAKRAASKSARNHAYEARHRLEREAYSAVAAALDSGLLKREHCLICHSPRTEGHHDDYSKPLAVRWLCDPCHHMWHRTKALAG